MLSNAADIGKTESYSSNFALKQTLLPLQKLWYMLTVVPWLYDARNSRHSNGL